MFVEPRGPRSLLKYVHFTIKINELPYKRHLALTSRNMDWNTCKHKCDGTLTSLISFRVLRPMAALSLHDNEIKYLRLVDSRLLPKTRRILAASCAFITPAQSFLFLVRMKNSHNHTAVNAMLVWPCLLHCPIQFDSWSSYTHDR